ncbi:hypothetical protein BCU44_12070 [Vibrio cyclitrophicus]|nr:hypothetical protein BCU44_12070 [Vibrio cyclitrophicus]
MHQEQNVTDRFGLDEFKENWRMRLTHSTLFVCLHRAPSKNCKADFYLVLDGRIRKTFLLGSWALKMDEMGLAKNTL